MDQKWAKDSHEHGHLHGHSRSSSEDSHDHSHGHSHGHSRSSSKDSHDHSHGHNGWEESLAHDHHDKKRTFSEVEADRDQRRLMYAMMFVTVFFIVEVVGGIIASSIAIMTDAAHLLTDISSFILAIIAAKLSRMPPSKNLSYGLVRAEVLSALFSTLFIWLLTGALVWEAILRMADWFRGEGVEVNGKLMTYIAIMGLVVNIVLLMILGFPSPDDEEDPQDLQAAAHGHSHGHSRKNKKKKAKKSALHPSDGSGSYGAVDGEERRDQKSKNINVSAAYLHAITDLLQNVGVILAGVTIWIKPNWQIADPMCTILFAILVICSTTKMIQSTVSILLEAVPHGVDWERVQTALSEIEGVTDVHDLHIWSLTLGKNAVTAHLKATNPDQALREAHKVANQMGLSHVTIQVQKDECAPEECLHPCVASIREEDECCRTPPAPKRKRSPFELV